MAARVIGARTVAAGVTQLQQRAVIRVATS
jgi:hypothetical protein